MVMRLDRHCLFCEVFLCRDQGEVEELDAQKVAAWGGGRPKLIQG